MLLTKCSLFIFRLLYPEDRTDLYEEVLNETGINPEKRSFELEIENFRDICDVYNAQCAKYEGLLHYNYMIHKKKGYELESNDSVAESAEKEAIVELEDYDDVVEK